MPSQKQVSFETITSLVYERKFDTALRTTTITEFKHRYNHDSSSFDDKLITKSNKISNLDDTITDSRLYTLILQQILNDSKQSQNYNPNYVRNIHRIPNIISQTVNVQWNYINSQNYLFELKDLQKHRYNWLNRIELSNEILNLMVVSNDLNKIIIRMNKIKDTRFKKYDKDQEIEEKLRINSSKIKYLNIEFVWSERILYINFKNSCYLMPISYILLIYNKINDLISILVYTLYNQDCALDKFAYYTCLEFIECLIQLHITYKDNYFTIAKTLESLCVAETLLEIESWKNKEFLISLFRELLDEVSFDYLESDLRYILRRVSTPFRHELCCLSKILGHPFVDMKVGSQDLFNKVQESVIVDLIKINECTNYIKENYIKNHILRHGKWPPVQFLHDSPPLALLHAMLQNKDPNSPDIEKKYGKVYIDQYSHIDLLPNMRFKKLENYIPYLKDKTVTLCRTKLFKHLWPANDIQQRESWKETRLLLIYLLNSNIVLNHSEYIDKFIDSEDLNELLDYLVIRIVPKEKELKIKFRGFGCKTYEDRARALAQEINVMEFLDTYSDEQAMTLGELPLTKKLFAFRSILTSFKQHKVLYINLDASSWNNRFRSITVDHVMSNTLDGVFGKKIFSKTHKAFEKTFVYVPDEKDFYYWNGQSGGIEGLNQDTWVVTYLGQIKSAMKPLGYKYYILCRGDDVRIAILIPPLIAQQQSLHSIKTNIVNHLQSSLSMFGQKIKIAESYGSEHYFTFSKYASIYTIEMPQVYRKIQKAHGANNAFISTLDEYIASAFSNVHSSCRVSPNTTPVYVVAIFWMIFDLMNHNIFSELSDLEYVALTLTPSIVGGYPIIYLHNMFVRAESDLLSPFIGLIMFLKKHNRELYMILINFLKFSTIKPKSLIALYKDPYSLPLNRPTLPTTLLRMQIIPSLQKLTRNESIRELFEYIDMNITEDILRCLESCNIQNVRVFSNVYSATPKGLLDEILRKFETSRSVYELLILRGGLRLAYKVMKRVYIAERRLQRWRFNRLKGIDTRVDHLFTIDDKKCPAETAQYIREKLWNKKIEGVTMPPLQHQLILTNPLLSQTNDYSLNNHFTYYCSDMFLDSLIKKPTQHYLTSGKKPFLGYSTRSGTIAPSVHFVEKDSILIKVKNILDLISWTSKQDINEQGELIESNFPELLHYIIKLYSPEKIEKLGPFSGKQKSGTVQHHMRSPSFKESIVPNILSNVYQQIVGITNSHLTLRKSKEHYKVNFLHIYCYTTSTLYQELDYKKFRHGTNEVWVVTNPCHHCSQPIKETPIVCNLKCLTKKSIRPLKLTEIGNITEKLLITSVKEFELSGIKIGEIPTELNYEVACAGVLQEFIDQTYTSHTRISARYGISNMTEESRSLHTHLIPQGRSRDIGQTEIKNITPEFLVKYLIPKIYLEVIIMFPRIHKSNASSCLSAIPGNEFPWFGLINQIYKAGQLGRFVTELHKISSIVPSNCFDNPARASYYIAMTSFYIQENNPVFGKFIILSNYKDSDILLHLKTFSIAVLRRIIIKEIFPYLKGTEYTAHVSHVKKTRINNLGVLILYCSRNPNDDEYYNELTQHIREVREGKIKMLSSDAININIIEYDTLTELIENESLDYLHKQITIYPNWEWEEAYINLKDNFDEILIMYDTYSNRVKIDVIYTDLPTCIAYIRSERPNDDVLDFLEVKQNIIPERYYDGPKGYIEITTSRLLMMTNHMDMIDEDMFLPRDFNFLYDKVILQNCYNFRIYGEYTTSLNKICEIFSLLNLPNTFGHNINIACLGEGYGGILDLIARLCFNSKFIFVTLPPNPEIETYPYAARESLQIYSHHVEFAHHSIGLYDLSEERTLKYLESLRYHNYLTICDAEIKDYQSPKRTRLLNNVITYYLRNRSENGILILKMNLCEGLNLHNVIGTLLKYVDYCSIFRCNASNLGGEIYIIAYGGRYSGQRDYDEEFFRPNLHTYIQIEHYRLLHYNNFLNSFNGKFRQIDITSISAIHKPFWKNLNMKSCGLSKLINRCDFPPINGFIVKLLEKHSIHEKLEFFITMLSHTTNHYLDLIDEKIDFETRVGVWDETTRRHKSILGEKWLRQKGVIELLRLIIQDPNTTTIHEQQIRQIYEFLLKCLPSRLKWLPLTSKSFKLILDDRGFVTRPYQHFIEGCNIAIMIYNWIKIQ
jgi:hypothetical protein